MPSSRILICVFAVALTITLLACGGAVSNNPSAQATSSSSSSTSTPASAPTILNITDASSTNSNPNCAATWLASLQQIEAGIDNCVSITPALTGSTLSWQVTGNTATIDHYAVFTSSDGTTLTPIGSVPPTTTNFNLTTANLSPANYAVFIQAVGKPSVLNKISLAVLYAAKQPPTVAVSVSPTSGSAPLAVNASITSSAATGSVISSNSINFGDGTVVNAATATHTYSASGTYTVTATATDNNNLSSTATATVTVAASLQPPTAKLTVTPTSGTAPLAVSASTAGSTDPNTGGSITSTTINFGDGTVVNAATASHTYNSAGTYTVTATVTDNNKLSSTATATVTVSAALQPPTAKLTVTPTSGTAPLAVSASTAGSTDPNTGGSITSTTINFGDGTVVNAATASHTYNSAGTYTVTATVTDNNKLSSTATATVVAGASTPPPSSGQTRVTLNGNSYTLQSHPRVWLDGPSGTLAAATSPGAGNGRAVSSNPAYQGLVNEVAALVSVGYTNIWADALGTYGTGWTDARFSDACLLWWAQGANPSDPNGYLAICKYGLDHIEDLYGSSAACDETKSYCNGRGATLDYVSQYVVPVMQAYSIARSQMSSAERTAFANKILNDNAQAHNGLGLAGSPTLACTRPSGGGPGSNDFSNGTGTISFARSGPGVTTTVTGYGTSFTSQTPAGTVLTIGAGDVVAKVTSVTNNNQLTAVTLVSQSSAAAFRYAPLWNTTTQTDCGLGFLLKHHNAAPPLDPTKVANYNTDYPTAGLYGGTGVTITTPIIPSQAEFNLALTKLYSYLAIGFALADDDQRAVTLLQQSYNYYYNYVLPWKLSQDTGFDSGGPSYGIDRTQPMTSGIAIMVQNSVVSGPPIATWESNTSLSQVAYYPYVILPDQSFSPIEYAYDLWGWTSGVSNASWAPPTLLQAMYLNSSTTQAQWAESYLQSQSYTTALWQQYSGSYLHSEYIFYNPAATATSYTTAPTQYAFRKSGYSACVAAGLPNCTANIDLDMAISKSDWTATASQVMMQGGFQSNYCDHLVDPNYGSYHIYRNGPLLSGSGGSMGAWNDGFDGTNVNDNLIALGGGNIVIGVGCLTGGYAPMTRWAGTDPTGDSLSRYAYAMYNLTNVYQSGAGATGVYRHVFHFKKSSAPDYVLSFDDVTAAAALQQAYFHYWRNNGTNTITYNASARTMSNLNSSTSMLLTRFCGGTDTGTCNGSSTTIAMSKDNSDGSYSGQPAANTYRVYICSSTDGSTCNSSATHGEWWAVHLPTTNLSATMPAITQPTCSGTGGSCAVVQIADATTPKVAVVARSGVTLTQASFTSTHSGTAQYVVAGLAPGIYNVTVGGSTVVSGATVNANDNTLYFESTAGSVTVTPAP